MNSAQLFYYIASGIAAIFAIGALVLGTSLYVSHNRNKVRNKTLVDVVEETRTAAEAEKAPPAQKKGEPLRTASIFDDSDVDATLPVAPRAAPRITNNPESAPEVRKSAQFDFSRSRPLATPRRAKPVSSGDTPKAFPTRSSRRAPGPGDSLPGQTSGQSVDGPE